METPEIQRQNTLLAKDQDANSKQNRMKRKPMFDQTGHVLLNGVKLTFQRGFGFSQDPQLNSSAYCIDDNKVVYVLTKQIIQYDMLTQNQKVIDEIDQDQTITSFIYFKNLMLDDNIIYAIHAMNKTYPSIIMKNYSKNITQKYVMAHLQKQEKIVSIALISQNRYACVLSELQGTFKLSYIDVQTKEIMATQSIYSKVAGMFIPPSCANCLILYSQSQLYMINFGSEIKPIALAFSKTINLNQETIVQAIPSLFNDLQLYIITNKGNLYFVNINPSNNKITKIQKEFLGTFETINENGEVVTKNRMPSAICCNQYNIIIGYHFIEEFTLVKICPIMMQRPAVQTIKFYAPNLHKIVRMSFAHETMSICVIVQVKQNDRYDLSIPIQSDYLKQKGQQILPKQTLENHLLPPGKIFPIVFNLLLYDTLVQTLRSPIQSILGWMLFVKQILDIAILPTKKILLILSKQKKIKAVKYQHISSTSFERMLIWETHFNQNDNPSSLDIHPLTFNVAVGFKDGIKLFTLSSEGLKANNIQFPLKNCQSVRYSKFGHKLIAGSSNQIIIINPYQNKIINSVNLSSGYNIKELNFIDRDMYISAQFGNGSSMIMNSQGGKVLQVWKKQNKTLCSTYDSVFDIMVVSYNESFTKFYRERGTQQFGVLWTYPFNVTKLLIVNQLGTIFMGTSTGKVRAYQWPFTDMMRFNKSFTEIQLHSCSITKMKIIHDFSMIITGAEDGSIFISKINAYSDGIAITDSQIMHSIKSNSKNFTNLYYLQPFMITSSAIQFTQQETIVQLQSDKADFQSEYNEIIMGIQQEIDEKVKLQQKKRQDEFRKQIQGREKQIQQLNAKKIEFKQKINAVLKQKQSQENQMQQKKLTTMRELYKQSDQLKQEKNSFIRRFANQIAQLKKLNKKQLDDYNGQLNKKENELLNQCKTLQKQFQNNTISNEALMKEQAEQGVIYKQRMISKLEAELEQQKEHGQMLRKDYNKIHHDNATIQDKLKYFQQVMTQMNIATSTNAQKNVQLQDQIQYLTKVLETKDKQILEQERNVKELLTKNINNYTHEEFLKYKQDQLQKKAKYLENQIQELEEKYNSFQGDFVQTSNQTNDLITNIQTSQQTIKSLKSKQSQLKQTLYMRKYKTHEVLSKIEEAFHQTESKLDFIKKIKEIFETISDVQLINTDNNCDQKIGKRDHLIKQVVNTNNLRKIDDSIRRTIMVKLNRQTVSLTCEVNELRKQKKKLNSKLKEVRFYIKELNEMELDNYKQNISNLEDDIVPANISIIRTKPSKHQSVHKLLPFQLYHSNKKSKHQDSSIHNRTYTKGDLDESSTQLPSLLPSILKNSKDSLCQSSRLFGVQQMDDEILMQK